jgi:hypothetical protein
LQHNGRRFAHRVASRSGAALTRIVVDIEDPLGATADTFLASCAGLVRQDGADGIELDGGTASSDSAASRFGRAAQRRARRADLGADPAEHTGDLIAGLVTGRTDLISWDQALDDPQHHCTRRRRSVP